MYIFAMNELHRSQYVVQLRVQFVHSEQFFLSLGKKIDVKTVPTAKMLIRQ